MLCFGALVRATWRLIPDFSLHSHHRENLKSYININICTLFGSVEKTKYMFLYRHEHEGESHEVKMENESFQNASEFEYVGITRTNGIPIHSEIKRRLNSGAICHHSIQNNFFLRPLSKDQQIKICM
jgi:hypothetical protein